jgi:hypothetical protein
MYILRLFSALVLVMLALTCTPAPATLAHAATHPLISLARQQPLGTVTDPSTVTTVPSGAFTSGAFDAGFTI